MKTVYMILVDAESEKADHFADWLEIILRTAHVPVLGMVWSDATDATMEAIMQHAEQQGNDG